MEFDWISLARCARTIVDNRGRTCPVGNEGIPLIATNCLRAETLYPTYETERFVSSETYSSWFRGHPVAGDIIFVLKGSPGRVCLTPDPVDFCIAQDMVAIRADERLVYQRYLFALLRSATTRRAIEDLQVGTMIPHFKKGDFDKLMLPIPDRPMQEAIGDMHFELCERIDVLRQTNSTLEAIAQALFKSWFVDFDPVRAKAEGREPVGMDAATAALFPSEFEESELGLIPKGWRVMPLLDACDLQGGGQPPASVFIDEPKAGYIRLLQIRDFSSDAHVTYIPESKKLKTAQVDDILIGRYGSASGDKQKDSLGRICRGLAGAYNVALMKLVPISVGREFAHQLFNDPSFYNYLQGVSAKAVQSGFSKKELALYRVVVPRAEILTHYESLGAAVWQRVKLGRERIATLSAVRDTLLPRVISGKLGLPEAEVMIDEVDA